MTRMNMIKTETMTSSPVLIPFIDFCNHDPTLEPSLDYDTEKQLATLTCSRDYLPGEEICFYYGNRNNEEFLINNGFIGKGFC